MYYYLTHNDQTIENGGHVVFVVESRDDIDRLTDKRNCRMPRWVGKPIFESATPVEIWRTVEEQIAEAQSYLGSTAYIAEKIAEAQLYGRNTASLKTEYAAVLAKREEARALIRKLQGKAAETALSALPAAPAAAAKLTTYVFNIAGSTKLPAGGSWLVAYLAYRESSPRFEAKAGGSAVSGMGWAIRIA